jgi:hypothetical protein
MQPPPTLRHCQYAVIWTGTAFAWIAHKWPQLRAREGIEEIEAKEHTYP